LSTGFNLPQRKEIFHQKAFPNPILIEPLHDKYRFFHFCKSFTFVGPKSIKIKKKE